MAAHIRAKYKDDQAGIGYSNIHDDKLWTEQQDSFHDLLQQLQETKDLAKIECPVDKAKITSGQSLELKSKRSRSRAHTKDLANIFGEKNLDECIKPEVKLCKPEPGSNISIGSTDTTGGILTIMGGTMGDYFKQKIPSESALDSSSPEQSDDAKKNHTELSGSSKNKQVVNSSFQNDDDESYKHKAEFIGVLKGTHKIGLEKNVSQDCGCFKGLKIDIKFLKQFLRIYSNTLPTLSCSDVKCSWKKDHNRVLETYIPQPLEEPV
ncbi:hypothetical protein PV328_008344 [Microctonus aethiopoides]|uniref:Uncharacterized protein n=1 Tax=Microctonus aethiopoides TaxID=144406 RepID=A0AA39FJE0_9HYME|nr:hypothetical protein PV328_008344 [Microctonus aethiopoides]